MPPVKIKVSVEASSDLIAQFVEDCIERREAREQSKDSAEEVP